MGSKHRPPRQLGESRQWRRVQTVQNVAGDDRSAGRAEDDSVEGVGELANETFCRPSFRKKVSNFAPSKPALIGLWVFLTCILPALIKRRGVLVLFDFCLLFTASNDQKQG